MAVGPFHAMLHPPYYMTRWCFLAISPPPHPPTRQVTAVRNTRPKTVSINLLRLTNLVVRNSKWSSASERDTITDQSMRAKHRFVLISASLSHTLMRRTKPFSFFFLSTNNTSKKIYPAYHLYGEALWRGRGYCPSAYTLPTSSHLINNPGRPSGLLRGESRCLANLHRTAISISWIIHCVRPH